MTPATLEAKTQGLKVYISADMEGVAGVVGREQLEPQGFEYSQFRTFITAEVNAAVEAARDEGATEIVISDSHGYGLNLLLDALPQDIQLVGSWPRPLGMMEGIDDSFCAAIFIGYHASVGNIDGSHSDARGSASPDQRKGSSRIKASAGADDPVLGLHFFKKVQVLV